VVLSLLSSSVVFKSSGQALSPLSLIHFLGVCGRLHHQQQVRANATFLRTTCIAASVPAKIYVPKERRVYSFRVVFQ